jgi:hypothetical protein
LYPLSDGCGTERAIFASPERREKINRIIPALLAVIDSPGFKNTGCVQSTRIALIIQE